MFNLNKICKTPVSEVNAIIHNNQNEILFLKTKNPETKQLATFPGGLVKYGENIETALKRTTLEQTCLEIEPIDILGIYSHLDLDREVHTIKSVFICITVTDLWADSNEELTRELNHQLWIDKHQIEKTELAEENKVIINDYFSWRNQKSTFWTTKFR